MRTLLKLLSIFAVIAAFYYLHYYWDRRIIQKDSAIFVNNAVNDIANHWDVKGFNAYADPAAGNGKNTEKLFGSYRTLGKLTEPVACEIEDFTSYKYPDKNVIYISSSYQCEAQFEKGPATIQLTLYRFSNSPVWKIRSFDLYSSYLSQSPPKTEAAPAKASGSQ